MAHDGALAGVNVADDDKVDVLFVFTLADFLEHLLLAGIRGLRNLFPFLPGKKLQLNGILMSRNEKRKGGRAQS